MPIRVRVHLAGKVVDTTMNLPATTATETKAAGAAPVVDLSEKSPSHLPPLTTPPLTTHPWNSPPFSDWALRAAEGLAGWMSYEEATREYEEMKRERSQSGMEYLWEEELYLMDEGSIMDTRW